MRAQSLAAVAVAEQRRSIVHVSVASVDTKGVVTFLEESGAMITVG